MKYLSVRVYFDPFIYLLLFTSPLFSGKLNVVASSTDLAGIAKEIGKDLVHVQSLARGGDDLHYIPARPDFIVKTNRADVFLLIGADLEIGWVPLILRNSRNSKVQPGGAGYCDVSQGMTLLEKKVGEVNRQMGDVHPSGNPHYWNEPINGIKMAKYIQKCLSGIDRRNKKIYQRNYLSFQNKLKALTKRLLIKMKPYFGKSVLAYHSEFIYLAKRFRLRIPLYIEEKPGVSPGPSRIQKVIRFMKDNSVKIILTAPWNPRGAVDQIARKVKGAKVIVVPMQTGSMPGTETYLKMLEKCIDLVAKSLRLTQGVNFPAKDIK